MSRIFINYRRGDAATNASRLCEWLADRYGEDQVFMDVDTIEPGRPWREAIDLAVGSSDLVLAVIGRDWLTELRRRLDDSDDFMRHELETAFRRDVRIIPVLVEGAEMPRRDELPDTLVQLSEYQAFAVRNERWEWDKQALLRRVDRVLAIQPEAVSSPPPVLSPAAPEPTLEAPEPSPAAPEPTLEAPEPSPAAPPTPALDAALESELNKWNWGAFLLTWIWGVGHGVYRSFLTLVPIYGIYEWILLGRNGNRWAWETRSWDSVESFRNTQRKWAMWGIIVDAIIVIVIIASASG
jgi:hypothetical protein